MLVEKGPGDSKDGAEPGGAAPQLSAELLSSMAPIDHAGVREKAPAAEDGAAAPPAAGAEEGAPARRVVYGPVDVTLVDGTCECFGTELVCGRAYTFAPGESVGLFTWTGCLLRLQGGATTTRLCTHPHIPTYTCLPKQRRR